MEPMAKGITKSFACPYQIFGSWISINKTSDGKLMAPLHVHEVRVYGGKYKWFFHSECGFPDYLIWINRW